MRNKNVCNGYRKVGVREIVKYYSVFRDHIVYAISFYNLAGGSSSSVGGMARSSSLRRRAELLATKRSSAVEPSSQVICFIKTLTDMKIRTTHITEIFYVALLT